MKEDPTLVRMLGLIPDSSEIDLKLDDGSRVGVIGGGPAGSYFTYFLLSMAEMMGMDVPPKAATHTMLSGKLSGFATDPANNFGSRTYEFPVNVLGQKQIRTLIGTDGTNIKVALTTTNDKIVAGQPTTLVLTTTNADGDDPMMTHVDALIKVRKGYYIGTQSAERGSDMMPMNGAYHGHLGQVSLTHTFPSAGNYVVKAELSSLGVSKVQFPLSDVRFNIQVAENIGSGFTPITGTTSDMTT